MRISRLVVSSFTLLALGNVFVGCLNNNVGMPPGGYQSEITCTSTLKCNNIRVPPCTKNEHLCYEGKCVISDIPGCIKTAPLPTLTATTPSAPAPTLSPTIEPAPAAAPN